MNSAGGMRRSERLCGQGCVPVTATFVGLQVSSLAMGEENDAWNLW